MHKSKYTMGNSTSGIYQNSTFIIGTPVFFHIAFFTQIKKQFLAGGQQYFHSTYKLEVQQVQDSNLLEAIC